MKYTTTALTAACLVTVGSTLRTANAQEISGSDSVARPDILLYTSVVHQIVLASLLFLLRSYGMIGMCYAVLTPVVLSAVIAGKPALLRHSHRGFLFEFSTFGKGRFGRAILPRAPRRENTTRRAFAYP